MPRTNFHKRYLPAPYKNPWSSLGQALIAVIADLSLRAKEAWRRNLQGEFPTPLFWPERLSSIFWPLLLSAIFIAVPIAILLSTSQLGFILSLNSQQEKLTISSAIDNSNEVGETLLEANNLSKAKSLDQRFKPIEKNANDNKSLIIDPVIVEILQEDNYFDQFLENILLELEITPLGNGISIRVSDVWSDLTYSDKLSLTEHLYTRLSEFGYEKLELKNKDGLVIAREPFIGSGMIILDSSMS